MVESQVLKQIDSFGVGEDVFMRVMITSSKITGHIGVGVYPRHRRGKEGIFVPTGKHFKADIQIEPGMARHHEYYDMDDPNKGIVIMTDSSHKSLHARAANRDSLGRFA